MRLVGLVPVLGLLLAGCGGGSTQAEPKPLPPVSASPSPTAVALEVPPSARAATPEGAAAFARYYVGLLGQAYDVGVLDELDALSLPNCGFCSDLSESTREALARGNSYSGGAYTVFTAEATEDQPGDALVDLTYQRAAVTRSQGGRVVTNTPGTGRKLLQVRLMQQAGSWRVRGVAFPEVPK